MNENLLSPQVASNWAGYLWLPVVIVWVAMRASVKQTQRTEDMGKYAVHVFCLLLSFWLLFERDTPLGMLERIVVPQTPAVLLLGLVLTISGVALAIWSRLSLGANWSAIVTLKKGHELVRSGPYRWIRHPIYSGILLGLIGSALVRGHLRGWLGFVIFLASIYFKARREERLLHGQFGETFDDHARRTGMFLPKLI